MDLSVHPPLAPMLATLTHELPRGEGLLYEPKWDGFRCIVFRSGPELELWSRNERSLDRYFPELREPLLAQLPERCAVDGEIVIVGPKGLDWDALLQRIHPAESRVRRLARETPASFVAFDLLALGDRDLLGEPLRERRRLLEQALGLGEAPVHLTPATTDPSVAAEWYARFEGAGLDGVMVKDLRQPYRPGERTMVKVKHQRTADCVVAGFRWHKDGGTVGSLLLGLYDSNGVLHHVGVATGFTAAARRKLVDELAPLRERADVGHPWGDARQMEEQAGQRRPGAQSRFSAGKDMSWEPLRAERVAEVQYDHLQGDRFRHATRFLRWRPDRRAESCTYDQLEAVVPEELSAVFRGHRHLAMH